MAMYDFRNDYVCILGQPGAGLNAVASLNNAVSSLNNAVASLNNAVASLNNAAAS